MSEDLALPALDELISSRFLLEEAHSGIASGYAFTNDMLRDVVYTEAGDARRRLFHQRVFEILEEAGESDAVLVHHAVATGLVQEAFRHSLAAGREALRLTAVFEAIVHFERALQLVQDAALPSMPEETDLRDLYLQLSRAYELAGQTEKASAILSEGDLFIQAHKYLPDSR
jgi:predicted ATPase